METREFKITENIIIDDVDDAINRLQNASGLKNIDIQDISDFINKQKNTCFYFNRDLTVVEPNDSEIVYLWMDTGLVNADGYPLFISTLRYDNEFVGHFVGTTFVLKNTVSKFFPKNRTKIDRNSNYFMAKYARKADERELKNLMEQYSGKQVEPVCIPNTEMAKQISTLNLEVTEFDDTDICEDGEYDRPYENHYRLPLTEDVHNMLLINNWHSIDGLDRYLKVIGTRIKQMVSQEKTAYYVINDAQYVVVNTGLLDKFGTDIKVMYQYNRKYDSYSAYRVLESKQDYVNAGYTKEQIAQELLPITFFDGSEIFEPNIEDFDVNPRSLYHIIDDRKERLPEDVRSMSEAQLATRINNELELGLKIQKRDHTYAKPSFSNSGNGHIAWMIPMRINRKFNEEPELVLVLRKAKDFWEIKTILPYDDDVKDKIMCLSLYGHLW